ncbi:MAG: lipopolysaccharide transport periplasmic protein LptA [Desulfobacteraceae bacterium]|nr:lipopolysaccharide transport periplasmic protein LptA [Desulfobacteraceae bacterium]
MKCARYQTFFLIAFLFSGIMLQGVARSESLKKHSESEKGKSSEPRPIVIKSNLLEVDNKRQVVTFTGEVNARQDVFILDCQKMFVYYKNPPGQEKSGEAETKIDKIVAMGEVRIKRTQGGVATAEKAVYYQSEEKMVLTGKPVVRQGKNFVEGDRITLFLKESRSVVESSKGKKVKAVIFPKEKKR